MIQDRLANVLNPLAQNEVLNGQILTKVSLVSCTNIIPHGLGRPLLGWYITRIRYAAMIYDTQDTNPNPASTLFLTVSANVVVDIAVF